MTILTVFVFSDYSVVCTVLNEGTDKYNDEYCRMLSDKAAQSAVLKNTFRLNTQVYLHPD